MALHCMCVQSCLKLLGAYVDRGLGFRDDIGYICNKPGRRLAVLEYLATSLGRKRH